jgi:hypothetical protein
MENHGLGSTPVERVASIKWTTLNYGMFKFGVVRQDVPVKLSLPHDLYGVPDGGQLL